MKNCKYILLDTGSESNVSMMSDVSKLNNGIQTSEAYKIKNKLLYYLMKVHFSYRLNCKHLLPLKSIWNKFSIFNELITDENTDYYIIIVNNAVHKVSIDLINKLAKKENVHLVSLLLDSFDRLPPNTRKMIQSTNFDLIYSFQKSDCEKYGFIFTNTIYSKVELPNVDQSKMNDVYFIGSNKGRIKKIHNIYNKLSKENLKCDFTVIVNSKKLEEYSTKYDGINITDKRIGYNEILNGIANSKCILELCQKGQDGLTMRFYEAVFYNKKLITNNHTAANHILFNPKYMNIIDDYNDIDINMLKSNDVVEYNYNGEMSPINFVQNIPSDLKNSKEVHL